MNQPVSFSGRVAHGIAWSSMLSFGVKVFGTLITFIILKRLSLHEYGTYQLVLAAWGVLLTFLFSGIDQILIAEGARARGAGDEQRALHLGAGYFLLHLCIGAILWFVSFFGPVLLSHFYSSDILQFLRFLSWIFLLVPFQRLFNYHFSCVRDFFAMNAINLVEEAIKGLGVIVAFYFFNARIEGVLIAMVGAAFLSTILFIPRMRWGYFVSFRGFHFKPFFHLIYQQGRWVAAQQFIRQFEKNLRPFFIQYFLGRPAVALFGLAEKMYGHIAGLVPVSAVLIPALSHDIENRDRIQRVFERGVKYTVPFYAAISLTAYFLLPPFLGAFFPQYIPALPLITIILLYMPFVGVAFVLTSLYVSHQEQRFIFFLVSIRFVLFCLLAPSLLRLFGVYGAALEFVLSLFLFNVLRYLLLVRRHPELRLRWSALFRIDDYDRAVFVRIKGQILRRLRPNKRP